MRLHLIGVSCLCSLLQGCLYTADRNHSPTGTIQLLAAPSLCGVQFHAEASDPDGDRVSYSWFVQVASDEPDHPRALLNLVTANGQSLCPARDAAGLSLASQDQSPLELGTSADLGLTNLPARGSYQVTLLLRDPLGAQSSQRADFRLDDSGPQLGKLRIDPDPKLNGYSLPDLNGKWPAQGQYIAWLDGVVDTDDDPRCSNSLNKRVWEPVGRSQQDFDIWEEVCDPDQAPFGALRFRLRPELTQADSEVRLRVNVFDALGGWSSQEVVKSLAANRPPCIMATAPYTDNLVKLSAAESNLFSITSVSDDVPQLMEYTWLVRDETADSFSLLAQQTSASLAADLTLPAWFRIPGQRFELRVTVREAGGTEPACSVAQQSCLCSELPDQECYRWVTWSVELQ